MASKVYAYEDKNFSAGGTAINIHGFYISSYDSGVAIQEVSAKGAGASN
jgi:hypothetical protein